MSDYLIQRGEEVAAQEKFGIFCTLHFCELSVVISIGRRGNYIPVTTTTISSALFLNSNAEPGLK